MTSYGSNAGFTTYHTERGNDISEFSEGEITIARLRATEWIDATFRSNFSGSKTETTQLREWPRSGAIDYYGNSIDGTVPFQIENAMYEAALRYETLTTDTTPKPYKRVTIDGALTVEYGDQSASGIQLQMPIIGQILSSLFGPSYSMSTMSSPAVRV